MKRKKKKTICRLQDCLHRKILNHLKKKKKKTELQTELAKLQDTFIYKKLYLY